MHLRWLCILPFVLALESTAIWSRAMASEALFKARCSSCHSRATTLARAVKGNSTEAKLASLSKFLETHHVPDPQERQAIAAYLVGLSK